MFGYVRAATAELRLREYDCYRALYCGLCKTMGKCTGQCSRFSLSYDFVFLAAVRMALLGERIQATRIRCLLHPFRRRNAILKSETLAYCAHASALLTYHKFADDLTDERGMKRARAILSRPLFKKAYRKAQKKYPALDQTIAAELHALSEIERDTKAPPSADAPALCFARLMEAVVAEGLTGADERIARAIGRAIGHWIYLIDAADDYEEDCKKDRYNPYRRLFQGTPTEEEWQSICESLNLVLIQAEQAHELMTPHPQAEINEIIANILYLGMPEVAKQKLKKSTIDTGEASRQIAENHSALCGECCFLCSNL